MSRPDWVTCIAHTHAHWHHLSWCGRNVGMEFHFTNVDHALYNGMQGGHLQTCPECAKAISNGLKKGLYVR